MKTLIIAFSLIFTLPAFSMEKMNQGDYSILATELNENRSVSIYLLPFNDLNASEFTLSFSFYKDNKNISFTIDKNQIISAERVPGLTVNDISGAPFTMEGAVLKVEYDLSANPEVIRLLSEEKKGRLSFKHISNSSVYLDRQFYRFPKESSFVALPQETLNSLNQLERKTIKLPVSLVMTTMFDMSNPH